MEPRIGSSTPFASTCRSTPVRTALVIVSVTTAASLVAAQGGTFRSGTELVPLQVTVLDAQRRYVADLHADDFTVFEEGVRQPVTLFATATAPLDLMLLLDTSGSMVDRMPVARDAAINFVRTLRPQDRAAVIAFNNNVRIAQPLTSDVRALEEAIRGTVPIGGTAYYEAVYIALRELATARRGQDRLRRQALVVLSDADDTGSRVGFEDVLAEARRNTVTVFTIFPPNHLSAWFDASEGQRPAPFELRALADETGGRAFAPVRIDDLSRTYGDIADELSQQYWLAYTPAPTNGGFRRVTVQVATKPGLRARTRSGYYPVTRRPASERSHQQ
jgi:Ca-activated chloride channel family protein